jgi:hypothetical protein
MLTLISACSPDEASSPDASNDSQYKPLKIIVTMDDSIQAPVNAQSSNVLSVSGTAAMGLQSSVPSNIGLNTLEYNGTALPNTQVLLVLFYQDLIGLNGSSFVYECDEIKVSIYYDNILEYESTRNMGSHDGTCADGANWTIQYTL